MMMTTTMKKEDAMIINSTVIMMTITMPCRMDAFLREKPYSFPWPCILEKKGAYVPVQLSNKPNQRKVIRNVVQHIKILNDIIS